VTGILHRKVIFIKRHSLDRVFGTTANACFIPGLPHGDETPSREKVPSVRKCLVTTTGTSLLLSRLVLHRVCFPCQTLESPVGVTLGRCAMPLSSTG
jgi:hypothetical protein